MSQKTNVTKKVNNKKRKRNTLISKIAGVVLLSFAIMIFINMGREVYTTLTLNKQSKEVQEELKILQEENSQLLQTKEKLEDPSYVTTYARGEYMFSRGDEKLFRLPSKD